ncbi:MAG TPA: GNAT family N-acetyltransferase, partial [Thermoanaerobaculia bacterium]|nr:GNAT family N-acetyltransferase [Thermoanaerobaculia bacterium]
MVNDQDPLFIEPANEADIAALVQLHADVAAALTEAHGKGPWSRCHSDRAIIRGLRESHMFVGRRNGQIEGTFRLAKRKPWAIDPAFFTPVAKPLYLLDMAVRPDVQRRGIGKALLAFAAAFASQGSFDCIRLDAYDAQAGAGGFYSKCGMACRGHRTYRSTPLVYFEILIRPESAVSVTSQP